MLKIKNEVLSGVLVIYLIGRLDSSTSKLFIEKMSGNELSSYARIVFNCKDLNYISSEGLRINDCQKSQVVRRGAYAMRNEFFCE